MSQELLPLALMSDLPEDWRASDESVLELQKKFNVSVAVKAKVRHGGGSKSAVIRGREGEAEAVYAARSALLALMGEPAATSTASAVARPTSYAAAARAFAAAAPQQRDCFEGNIDHVLIITVHPLSFRNDLQRRLDTAPVCSKREAVTIGT